MIRLCFSVNTMVCHLKASYLSGSSGSVDMKSRSFARETSPGKPRRGRLASPLNYFSFHPMYFLRAISLPRFWAAVEVPVVHIVICY